MLLIMLMLGCLCCQACGIDTLSPTKKQTTRIRMMDGSVINGYIVDISDSSIRFIKKEDWGKPVSFMQVQTITAERIMDINKKIRNGVTTGEGTLIGLAAGIVLGFTLGLSDHCDDPNVDCDFTERLFSTKSFRASLIFGTGFGIIGGIYGLISGSRKKQRIIINGQKENIKYNRNGIRFY
jgi:hypothetical protein